MSLKGKYTTKVIPEMMKKFNYKNPLAVPKLLKATVNVGVGKALKDEKFIDIVEKTLTRITSQKPMKTLAKKSISTFKIRQGMIVGLKVTLRGKRMYDFIDKLINITLPRIRDFRGLNSKSLDKNGNLTIGLKEHIVFPEIDSNEVDRLHGLEVTITTNAKRSKQALELFKLLGFPFKKS